MPPVPLLVQALFSSLVSGAMSSSGPTASQKDSTGSQPSEKRTRALEDAGDRAQKKRKAGLMRVPLEKIGFWPGNRGGLGISPYHVHEVAWDCVANKTKLSRYGHVDLLEVPSSLLPTFRKENRATCVSDPLMPRFHPEMEFVCASKTHFVHAQKLGKEGNRTLFNKATTAMITWQPGDTEAIEIGKHGPVCAIFEENIFEDPDAVNALCSDDNLNATVQLSEDEMQAFGRVDAMMNRMALSQGSAVVKVDQVIEALQVSGLGQFSVQEWKHFLALRSSLPASVAKILQTCQFNFASGRVRVRAADFATAAKLDKYVPWSKVSVMLWQYIGALDTKALSQGEHMTTFGGRKEVIAKKLKADAFVELQAERSFQLEFETFIKAILKQYGNPKPAPGTVSEDRCAKALLNARGQFLAICGRYIIKIGTALADAQTKAMARHREFTPDERERLLKAELKGKYSKIEGLLRAGLLANIVYTESSLPQSLCPPKDEETAHSQADDMENPSIALAEPTVKNDAGVLDERVAPDVDASVPLTDKEVFSRLCITGFNQEVFVNVDDDISSKTTDAIIKVEEDEDKGEAVKDLQGNVRDARGSQPSDPTSWKKGLLRRLAFPKAFVDVTVDTQNSTAKTLVVPIQSLRACSRAHRPQNKQKPVVVHPAIQDPGQPMEDYNYDNDELPFYRSVATHMSLWAHLSVTSSAERVRVHRLSEPGKLPFVLQAVAMEPFRKGTLFLVPASEDLVPDERNIFVSGRGQAAVHASMLSQVPVTVRAAGMMDRRRKDYKPEKKEKGFLMRSPLLAGLAAKQRDECLENLNPFWAALRSQSPKSCHNMEMETMVFFDSGFALKGDKFPKLRKSIEFSVELPILRNVANIEKGEILCLPFSAE